MSKLVLIESYKRRKGIDYNHEPQRQQRQLGELLLSSLLDIDFLWLIFLLYVFGIRRKR